MAKQTTALKAVAGGRVPDERLKLEMMHGDAARVAALGTLLANLGTVPSLCYLKTLGDEIACAGEQIGDVIDDWEGADWGGPIRAPGLGLVQADSDIESKAEARDDLVVSLQRLEQCVKVLRLAATVAAPEERAAINEATLIDYDELSMYLRDRAELAAHHASTLIEQLGTKLGVDLSRDQMTDVERQWVDRYV